MNDQWLILGYGVPEVTSTNPFAWLIQARNVNWDTDKEILEYADQKTKIFDLGARLALCTSKGRLIDPKAWLVLVPFESVTDSVLNACPEVMFHVLIPSITGVY